MLSDPTRRKEYDMLYNTRRPQEKTDQPSASANFFSTFTNMFGGAAGAQSQPAAGATPADRPDAEHVFADVFEEVSARMYTVAVATERILVASAGGRAASSLVDMARGVVRRRVGFHHCQHPWAHGGNVRGQPPGRHSGREGEERGCGLQSTWRKSEGGGENVDPSQDWNRRP